MLELEPGLVFLLLLFGGDEDDPVSMGTVPFNGGREVMSCMLCPRLSPLESVEDDEAILESEAGASQNQM